MFLMPVLSVFYGIVIKMYYHDHNPPHFHVAYGNEEAFFAIDSARVLGGHLPPRVLRLVVEWQRKHAKELDAAWSAVQVDKVPKRIAPLE